MTMKVYRFENSYGIGPYRYYKDELMDMVTAHADYDHPSPIKDPGLQLFITPNLVCGMDSMEGLLTWFNGYFLGLADSGYEISIWESENARVSSVTGQVVFDRSQATLLSKYVYRG